MQRNYSLIARILVSEYQSLHQIIENRVATGTEVGLGLLFLQNHLFRFLDGRKYRRFAFSIAVHAHSQVDLLRPGIILVFGDKTQDGVRGLRLQVFKQVGSPVSGAARHSEAIVHRGPCPAEQARVEASVA
jgi:hypothetical protein